MPAPRPDPPRPPNAEAEVTADTQPVTPDESGSGPPGPAPAAGGPQYPFLAPPRKPDELGRLGPYRVLGVLGRGGMGVVFRAEDPDLKRQVALKVMLPRYAADPLAAKRFVREAQAQAHVEHDHVIPIYQVGQDGGVPFIAMPLLKGQTLAAAMKAAPRLPPAAAVRIAREMAEGLAAAHERGLVHRDVKPGNVWLEGARQRVRILDFGLARPQGEQGEDGEPLTEQGAVVGTPAYMSPEQAGGEAVDPRTDLYGLGVVLYQMISGRLPFDGPSPMAILVSLATKTPPPVEDLAPGLPAGLAGLIRRLMAKDRAGRPASAAAVADELRRIELGLTGSFVAIPLSDGPADPWADLESTAAYTPPPDPSAKRKRAWLIWAAVGLSILAGAAGVAALLTRPATPTGKLLVDSSDPAAEVVVKRRGGVVEKTSKREIVLPVGEYELELAGKPPGLKLAPERVEVPGGGTVKARITAAPKPPVVALDLFRETHDATPEELDAWKNKLPRGYRPVWVAARSAPSGVRFDAVAAPDPAAPEWALHRMTTRPEIDADWKQMTETHRVESVCLLPTGDVRLWVKDDGDFRAWEGGVGVVGAEIAEARKHGTPPPLVGAALRGSETDYMMAVRWATGGPAWEWVPEMTAGELAGKVAECREKNWRPVGVSAHVGRAEAVYVGVFAESLPGTRWDFSPALTTADYEAALADRKAKGFRPQSVTSTGAGGALRYTVVWVDAAAAWLDGPAPDGVTDFRTATGVTEDDLKEWAENLPKGFRPSWIGARVGAAEPTFDAVALASGEASEWKLRTIEYARNDDMFAEMNRAAYRGDIRFLYKTPAGKVMDGMIWVKDGKEKWTALCGDPAYIAGKVAELRTETPVFRLTSFSAAVGPDGPAQSMTGKPGPGGDWETAPDLTLVELEKQVADNRKRGWRPEFVSATETPAGPRYYAVFTRNDARVIWDFQAGLTAEAFQKAVAERKALRLRPASVASDVSRGVVRYTAVWVGYVPAALASAPAPGGVTDFRSEAGLTEAGLKAWTEAIRADGFRPAWVSARAGAADPEFDVVAVADAGKTEWTLRTDPFEKHDAMYEEMHGAGFRCDVGFLYPAASGEITEGTVWVKNGKSAAAESWTGDRPYIDARLVKFHTAGDLRPANLTVVRKGTGQILQVNGTHGAKLEWETRFDLTADDLAREVEQHRRNDWRPETVAVADTGPGGRYFAVFVKNDPKVDWDFQSGLTPEAFAKAVEERKPRRFRPASVTSAVVEGAVRYTVVWVGYAPAPRFFSGTDLNGWEGRAKLWGVRDGALVGTPRAEGRVTALRSERQYRDFEVSFEVHNDNPAGTVAGVRFRTWYSPDGTKLLLGPACALSQKNWGAVTGATPAGGEIGSPNPPKPATVRPKDFNAVTLRVVGKRVVVTVNGTVTTDAEIDMPDEGVFAWFVSGKSGEVTFRNIRFQDLTEPAGR